MIQNSFIFLDRISARLEQSIWNQGIHNWDEFLSKKKIQGISIARKAYYDRKIREARSALYNFDAGYFSKLLPGSETYRLYDHFKDDAVYLDIETTGLSRYADVTLVGLYDGFDTKMMIKDINLDLRTLQKQLQQYKLIITFNGASFDLPFLSRKLPGIIPNIPHLDLKSATRKLGLTGGLKIIEKELEINRRELVGDITGGDALTLWKMYKTTGDDHYLNLLIEYNEEDIINLKKIANHCSIELRKQHLGM